MFYSSTFLSVILGFFVFLNMQGETITIVQNSTPLSFSNISYPTASGGETLSQAYDHLTIEFFDTFACAECDRMGLEIIPVLKNRYENDPQAGFRVVITPGPEDQQEYEAARGLVCAAEQSLFWKMYEALHAEEARLTQREVDLTAQGIGADIVAFRNCLNSESTQEKIRHDRQYAQSQGITHTPSLLINEYVLERYQPIENIDLVIQKVIGNAPEI